MVVRMVFVLQHLRRLIPALVLAANVAGAAEMPCESTLTHHALAVPASFLGDATGLVDEAPSGRGPVYAEVFGDHDYFEHFDNGWAFALRPQPGGWAIRLYERHPVEDAVDLTSITPPHHGAANARDVLGWHFRNAANTGPNEGDVNAPQEMRLFYFSPALAGTGGFKPSINADEPRLAAPGPEDGRGWLRVMDYGLADLAPGQQARMNYLKFQACLVWPRSSEQSAQLQAIAHEKKQRALDDANPVFLDEEREIMGSCGLDLASYTMEAAFLPRALGVDIDGDDAHDDIVQVRRDADGRRMLALCRAGTWLDMIGPSMALDIEAKFGIPVDQLEAWRIAPRDHGPFGYESEPDWPEPDGDVLVLERIEKSMILVYWRDGALQSQLVYRFVEP